MPPILRSPPRPAPRRRRRSRPALVAGRYLLHEEIGRGATGTVHRARDLRERREIAAKVLRTDADPDPAESLVRFVREQTHRIRHPHVLAPLGWAADDDVVLIAMELVPGGSLADLLALRGALPEAEVTVLLGQLLEALDAVHARGVVHGDVKPGNLLLRAGTAARRHLLLADFGVATRAAPDVVDADPTGAGAHPPTPSGTPGFLPPEALAGAPPHPSRDLYAAGVVARRALAAPGPLLTLADSMTRPEPHLRPTAAQALRRLHDLPRSPCRRGVGGDS